MGGLVPAVCPRPHEQMLGRLLGPAQCYVRLAGVARVGVVPASEVQGRHVGVLVVVLRDGVAALLPVVVVVAVGLDVDGPPLVGGQPPEYRGPLAQGELLDHIVHVGRVGLHDLGLQAGVGLGLLAGGGHAEHVDEESLLERAVLAHGAVVVVGRADADDHGRQVGRVEGGEGGLVAPGVGVAHRPHATGTPRLRAQPLDGVVAVGGLLGESVPLTLGLEAAADVLHGANVAPPREVPGVEHGSRRRLVVGRTN